MGAESEDTPLDMWPAMGNAVCNVRRSSTKDERRRASSVRGKPCRPSCPTRRTRMNCFATAYPGSGIGEASQATVVNSDPRPALIRADNEELERSGDAPSEF